MSVSQSHCELLKQAEILVREGDPPSLCPAKTKSGQPCRGYPIHELDGYCMLHSPVAAQGRRLGGQNSSTVQRLQRKMPLWHKKQIERLNVVIDQLSDGTLEPSVARTIISAMNRQLAYWESGAREMDRMESAHLIETQLKTLHEVSKAEIERREDSMQRQASKMAEREKVKHNVAGESPSDSSIEGHANDNGHADLAAMAAIESHGTSSRNGHRQPP